MIRLIVRLFVHQSNNFVKAWHEIKFRLKGLVFRILQYKSDGKIRAITSVWWLTLLPELYWEELIIIYLVKYPGFQTIVKLCLLFQGWICVWQCHTATPAHHLAFSPDGVLFATSGINDRLVKIWYQNKGKYFFFCFHLHSPVPL